MSGGGTDRVDTFFYGLFMDAQLLRGKGIEAIDPRIARLDGYRLSIGRRATLLETAGSAVHGVVMTLARADLQRLYSEESVRAYEAQPVSVSLQNGQRLGAIAYVLPRALHDAQPNPEYAAKLHQLAGTLGLPRDYLQEILQSTRDENPR